MEQGTQEPSISHIEEALEVPAPREPFVQSTDAGIINSDALLFNQYNKFLS